MGDLILFPARRGDEAVSPWSRDDGSDGGIHFYFALDCPLSYLTAERVERALGEVNWVPVLGPFSEADGPATCAERSQRAHDVMRQARREARILQTPLTAPRLFPMDSRRAARAATMAAAQGAAQRFSLAIQRLAFLGGFDISKEPVIRQAAEVAGLDPDELAAAASDPVFDRGLDATTMMLRAKGIDSPPAISIGESWFEGSDAVEAAMSFRIERVRLDA
jgi:2-hydroxychromene-2-carboxylate isomerase